MNNGIWWWGNLVRLAVFLLKLYESDILSFYMEIIQSNKYICLVKLADQANFIYSQVCIKRPLKLRHRRSLRRSQNSYLHYFHPASSVHPSLIVAIVPYSMAVQDRFDYNVVYLIIFKWSNLKCLE